MINSKKENNTENKRKVLHIEYLSKGEVKSPGENNSGKTQEF